MDELNEKKDAINEDKADDRSKSRYEPKLDFDWLFEDPQKTGNRNCMVAGAFVTSDNNGAVDDCATEVVGETSAEGIIESVSDAAGDANVEGTVTVAGAIVSGICDIFEGIFS